MKLDHRTEHTQILYCPALGCHNDDGHPRPLTPDTHVCPACVNRIRRNITKAPRLHHALRGRQRGGPTSSNNAGPVTGTKPPGLQWDIHADHLADRLLDTLQDYARTAQVLTGQPATGTAPTRTQWRLDRSLDTLTRLDHALWAHPYHGPAYARDTMHWLRQAWVHLGYGTGRTDLPNPCPRCDLLTLTRWSALDDMITCRYCRLVWDETSYADIAEQWLAERADEQHTRDQAKRYRDERAAKATRDAAAKRGSRR